MNRTIHRYRTLTVCVILAAFIGMSASSAQATSKDDTQERARTIVRNLPYLAEGQRGKAPQTIEVDGASYTLADRGDVFSRDGLPLERTFSASFVCTISTDTYESGTDAILAQLPISVDIEEDGYSGTIPYHSMSLTALQEPMERTVDRALVLEHLPSNEVAAIPETREFAVSSVEAEEASVSAALQRASVDFTETAWDAQGLPVEYSAHVVYRGLESSLYTSGYEVTALYEGTVALGDEHLMLPVVYTLGEEEPEGNSSTAHNDKGFLGSIWESGSRLVKNLYEAIGWQGVAALSILVLGVATAALALLVLQLKSVRRSTGQRKTAFGTPVRIQQRRRGKPLAEEGAGALAETVGAGVSKASVGVGTVGVGVGVAGDGRNARRADGAETVDVKVGTAKAGRTGTASTAGAETVEVRAGGTAKARITGTSATGAGGTDGAETVEVISGATSAQGKTPEDTSKTPASFLARRAAAQDKAPEDTLDRRHASADEYVQATLEIDLGSGSTISTGGHGR